MKLIVKEILESIDKIFQLKNQLDNPTYWIEKATKETNFQPGTDPWIHVEISSYKIEISVHPSHNGGSKGIYWINGKWFDTPFPKDFPFVKDINEVLKSF